MPLLLYLTDAKKGDSTMSIEQNIERIKSILKDCKFGDLSDRQYWESKLKEMETKAKAAKENEKYFRTMNKYDRL